MNRRRIATVVLGTVALGAGLGVLLPKYDWHPVGTGVMSPAIGAGQTVAVARGTAHRGDVAVVDAWDNVRFTVRVVAVGGDVVTCCSDNGGLTVNGKPVAEPYAHGDTAAFGRFTVTVPPGRVFVLGDQRSISVDSRSHLGEAGGTLPAGSVRGRVVAVAYPAWSVRPVSGGGAFALWLAAVLAVLAGVAVWIAAWWPELRRLGIAAVGPVRRWRQRRVLRSEH